MKIADLLHKRHISNTNLQANIAKSLLGIAHTESTITFGANLSPLKLLDAMNEPINPSSSPLLRHYPPNTARSRVCRYPSSVHPPPLHPAQKPPKMKEIWEFSISKNENYSNSSIKLRLISRVFNSKTNGFCKIKEKHQFRAKNSQNRIQGFHLFSLSLG